MPCTFPTTSSSHTFSKASGEGKKKKKGRGGGLLHLLRAPPAQTTREQRLQGPSASGLPGFDATSSSTFKADLLGPFMKVCRLCGKDVLSFLFSLHPRFS